MVRTAADYLRGGEARLALAQGNFYRERCRTHEYVIARTRVFTVPQRAACESGTSAQMIDNACDG